MNSVHLESSCWILGWKRVHFAHIRNVSCSEIALENVSKFETETCPDTFSMVKMVLNQADVFSV